MATRLGGVQREILKSLRRHGPWWGGCGWIWDNYSGTVRVLESLVKRGLVEKKEQERKRVFGAEYVTYVYSLTPAGQKEAGSGL